MNTGKMQSNKRMSLLLKQPVQAVPVQQKQLGTSNFMMNGSI